MEITLVRLCRMLAEQAVHLPFRNQTYVKMAKICHFMQLKET